MLNKRILKDRFVRTLMQFLVFVSLILVLIVFGGLVLKSWPLLKTKSLADLLFSQSWRPLHGDFGLLSFIIGTCQVTGFALIIALPFCLLTSVYLSEYADKKIKNMVIPLIDLLAGIPSVIYGLWGVLFVVPFIRDFLAPAFAKTSTGYSALAGAIVLAIMIFPVIIHVSLGVFETVPETIRHASLSLGATKWQTIKFVVLRRAAPGVLAAVILGVSRAFGETLAVLMVTGNIARISNNVFAPVYALPALIANNYGEMFSIPLYDAALMLAALVLFVVVVIFNLVSRLILRRLENGL